MLYKVRMCEHHDISKILCVNIVIECFLLKGVMSRVYETAVMLLLLILLVLGIVWVACALLHHNTARESLYGTAYFFNYIFFKCHSSGNLD